MKKILFIFLLLAVQSFFAQEIKRPADGFPTCSDCATLAKPVSVPKPEYPKEAVAANVSGSVTVEVVIDEQGNVVDAKAISGDSLFFEAAVKAAFKAKFKPATMIVTRKPVKSRGSVTYNFIADEPNPPNGKRIVTVGIVNKKALEFPKPNVKNVNHVSFKKGPIVGVSIIINPDGKVVYAKALTGHPLLRSSCEAAARKARFAPTIYTGPLIIVKALLVFKFKTDRTVITDIESDDLDAIETPINLAESSPPSCSCKFGENESVVVGVEIDENGIVTEARALSGHLILRTSSEKAALGSKFLPTNIKSKIFIVYNFKSADNRRSVQFENAEIKRIRINK